MDAYWVILLLSTITNLTLLVRLVELGTRRNYPAFFGFVVYQLIQNTAALTLGTVSVAYRHFWVIADPVNSVFYVLMVREAHRRAFSQYPGIASLARWMTAGAAVAALGAIALMLNVSPEKHLTPKVVISYSLLWEECVAFGLTAFILFMVFLLLRYPIELGSNLERHIVILCFAFLLDSVLLASVPTETSILARVRDFGIAFLWTICFAAWGIFLRKDSFTRVVSVRAHLSAEKQQELRDQLTAFNKVLANLRF